MPAAALQGILMTTPCDDLTDVTMDTTDHGRAVVDGPQNPPPPQGAAVYDQVSNMPGGAAAGIRAERLYH